MIAKLMVGRTYRFQHTRRGEFVGTVLSVDATGPRVQIDGHSEGTELLAELIESWEEVARPPSDRRSVRDAAT